MKKPARKKFALQIRINRIRRLQGSLKGKGVLEALMADRKRERAL